MKGFFASSLDTVKMNCVFWIVHLIRFVGNMNGLNQTKLSCFNIISLCVLCSNVKSLQKNYIHSEDVQFVEWILSFNMFDELTSFLFLIKTNSAFLVDGFLPCKRLTNFYYDGIHLKKHSTWKIKIERKRGMIPKTRKEMHLTLFNIVFHGVFYGTSHFVNSGFNLSLITTSAILKCFPCKAQSAGGEYKRHCTQTVIKIKRTKTYVIYSRCHRSSP